MKETTLVLTDINGRRFVVRAQQIYGEVQAIQAKKTEPHPEVCDYDCRQMDHTYVHEFKKGAVQYGLANGDLLIRSRK